MCAFVFNPRTEIGESSVAIFAGIRLLAGMRSHVSIQLEIYYEAFAANGAFERFFVPMPSHMAENLVKSIEKN